MKLREWVSINTPLNSEVWYCLSYGIHVRSSYQQWRPPGTEIKPRILPLCPLPSFRYPRNILLYLTGSLFLTSKLQVLDYSLGAMEFFLCMKTDLRKSAISKLVPLPPDCSVRFLPSVRHIAYFIYILFEPSHVCMCLSKPSIVNVISFRGPLNSV